MVLFIGIIIGNYMPIPKYIFNKKNKMSTKPKAM